MAISGKLTAMKNKLVKARDLPNVPTKSPSLLRRFCRKGSKTAMLALAVVLFIETVLASGLVFIHNGFYTGNDYIKLGGNDRAQYAMGLVNGMLLSPLFDAERRNLEWIKRHIEGMENYQLVAIIDKYLKENPERWHENMHALAYGALVKAFRK